MALKKEGKEKEEVKNEKTEEELKQEELNEVEGMELDEKIEHWKKKWKKLYKTSIDDQEYIWRTLKRPEYVKIMSETDFMEEESFTPMMVLYMRQELICKRAVLYPHEIEEEIQDKGGVSSVLADEILTKSGFDRPVTQEL